MPIRLDTFSPLASHDSMLVVDLVTIAQYEGGHCGSIE